MEKFNDAVERMIERRSLDRHDKFGFCLPNKKEPTAENTKQLITRVSKVLAERLEILRALHKTRTAWEAADKANCEVNEVRLVLPDDANSCSFHDAICRYESCVADSRQYINDLKSAAIEYAAYTQGLDLAAAAEAAAEVESDGHDEFLVEVANDLLTLANTRGERGGRALAQYIRRQHRTNQQALMRTLIYPILEMWHSACDTGEYDERNSATVRFARTALLGGDADGCNNFPVI